jgi:hypothetical protein
MFGRKKTGIRSKVENVTIRIVGALMFTLITSLILSLTSA